MSFNKTANAAVSGILLYAKQSGCTSFSSLSVVKRALKTRKIGHTGTLDSFAQGLLVVLAGKMTRLVSHITALDKEYEAVITFGAETDTLDPTGAVVKTAPLPSLRELKSVLHCFLGTIKQQPPAYSAVRINGQRLSDLARSDKIPDIPFREIAVHKSVLLEIQDENENIYSFDPAAGALNGGFSEDIQVKHARVRFTVSKGTYIRSLARDIGIKCGSCAYLSALLRTRVGGFMLPDAAGASLLPDFTLKNFLRNDFISESCPQTDKHSAQNEEALTQEICGKIQPFTPAFAKMCGYIPVFLHSDCRQDFFHGKPLSFAMFDSFADAAGVYRNCAGNTEKTYFAVFGGEDEFFGAISAREEKIAYECVISS